MVPGSADQGSNQRGFTRAGEGAPRPPEAVTAAPRRGLGPQADARARIGRTIAERRPRIVIAHSLSMIPAFDALHHQPDHEIDCFITLDAPLAVPGAVFEHPDPAPVAGTVPRPPRVNYWMNVADPGDPFAVPRPFKGGLPPGSGPRCDREHRAIRIPPRQELPRMPRCRRHGRARRRPAMTGRRSAIVAPGSRYAAPTRHAGTGSTRVRHGHNASAAPASSRGAECAHPDRFEPLHAQCRPRPARRASGLRRFLR